MNKRVRCQETVLRKHGYEELLTDRWDKFSLVQIEEILRRSVTAYLADIRSKEAFEPIGFGMWANREEMQDATKWVHELRGREWER